MAIEMIEWILKNKEWVFSGIGVFVITGIAGLLKIKKKDGGATVDNSSSVTISGDVNIPGTVAGRDVIIHTINIDSRTDELISILKLRAERIRTQLANHYKYTHVKKYLDKFEKLHSEHISALEKRNLILAHEILSDIHKLSMDLENEEFWSRHAAETPGVRYSLRLDAFQRGFLICEYVVGDMESYSNCYLSDKYSRNNIESIEKIYKRILDSNKP